MNMRCQSLLCLLLITACTQDSVQTPAMNLQQVLGGEADESYLRAVEPRVFTFPDDHGPHPGFRNEWWYLTGNLAAEDGRRFGYQLTFFNLQLPRSAITDSASNWHSERIWMAHFAVTDAAGRQHYAFERFARENPGLAGAQVEPFSVWLEDWRIRGTAGSADLPWQVQATEEDIGLDLQLSSAKAPVLQGDAGLSRKSATPGNASYYYSLTRLPTRGTLQLGNETLEVTGNSWLDREWSTSALDVDQTGWDWFSLQFDDGTELMYYQLRDLQGQAHPFSAGKHMANDGTTTTLSSQELVLDALTHWTSPTGITYTTTWSMKTRNLDLKIEAVLPDQWMNLSLPYWEGAVVVIDQTSGALLGRGYLEMVR
jgi:predicted secreted hydrolase